jgi:hypothetical protein
MLLAHPTLSQIQERVLAAYDIDVAKKPAYLLYRFKGDIHWIMITTQEELDNVIARAAKAVDKLVALKAVAIFVPDVKVAQ